MFQRRGRDKEYVVALEQKLEAAGVHRARKEILREIARVFDEQLEDPDEAASALLRALELEPDAETLGVLAALYRRQKALAGRGHHAAARAGPGGAPPRSGRASRSRWRSVYERDIGDDEAAVEAYRQALEFDPANREALDALERLLHASSTGRRSCSPSTSGSSS